MTTPASENVPVAAPAGEPAIKIAFVHYPGRIARLDACRAGSAPTEFLFGAIELERRGFEVAHFEIDPSIRGGRLGRYLDRFVHLGYLPPHMSSRELGQARRLLPELRRYDAVVGTTIATSLALAFWKKARRLDRPLLGIVTGLVDPAHRKMRRRISVSLLREMHVLLYGEAELEPMLALDRRLAGRVHLNQFGVDVNFWRPEPNAQNDGYVLAIGNDRRRDYETLVRAAESIPAPVRIYTRQQRPARLPGNVSWHFADWHRQALSDEEVRSLYQGASVVVVPLRDSLQPSGQSVTLQAMACGRPVVLTETRGLWSRAMLEGERSVFFTPPEDAGALTQAVRQLLEADDLATALGTRAREFVCSQATIEQHAERMLKLCREAIHPSLGEPRRSDTRAGLDPSPPPAGEPNSLPASRWE